MRFRGRQAVRAGSRLVGAIVLSLMSAGPATSGSYPETALSQSLATPPELVDEASLLFQLPSRAGISRTQIFAFNVNPYSYSSTTSTIGAVGQSRGQGGFLLAHPSALLENQTALQAGWGGAWGGLRLGLAARATRSEVDRVQSAIPTGPNPSSEMTSSQEQQLLEGSFGLGGGSERYGIDVAVDLQRLDDRLERYSTDDSTAVVLESDNDISYGVAGRFHMRLRQTLEVVGAGGWNRMRGDLAGTELSPAGSEALAVASVFESWSGGLAVSFATARLDRFTIAAHWSRRETLPSYEIYSSTLVRRSSLERGVLALSLQQSLWQELWGQAGVSLTYEEEGSERAYDSRYEESFYQDETTTFGVDFGWGVSYSWRFFEGRASVRETLPLQDLFAALDVFIRL